MDIESLKAEGQAFLEPLKGKCVQCSLRRRSSFGWVFEPCGLCVKATKSAHVRFIDRLVDEGWLPMPKWGGKYLAGDAKGPLPAPWVVYQPRGGEEPTMAGPGGVVRLLLLGNPMKGYVRSIGGIAIQWPKLFTAVALDETKRAAVDATVLLAEDGAFKPSEAVCASLYTFLLELDDSVFGGVAQENTQLKPVRATKEEFGPPIRVLGKVIR